MTRPGGELPRPWSEVSTSWVRSIFVNENPANLTLWADYGKDFYATTSFSDIPPADGRRIWMGWISNWEYANDEPTVTWRGAQSVPRELGLRRLPQGIRLVQSPIAELKALRATREGPVRWRGDRITLRVLFDRSVVEIFVNDGETVVTERFYPTEPFTRVERLGGAAAPGDPPRMWELR